jgi:hypothetical protein
MDKLREYLIRRDIPPDQLTTVLAGWRVQTKHRSGSNSVYYVFQDPDGQKHKSFTAVYQAIVSTVQQPAQPPPIQEVWEVDDIVDVRSNADGQREFLVKWTSTWVKEENLDGCKEAMEEFLGNR